MDIIRTFKRPNTKRNLKRISRTRPKKSRDKRESGQRIIEFKNLSNSGKTRIERSFKNKKTPIFKRSLSHKSYRITRTNK